jgi:RimJ/RimL family protein N-acetyltransferase
MLEGLLVDLVPYGKSYQELEPRWHNSEAWFWATVGDRRLFSADSIKRNQQERAEWRERQSSPGMLFGIQTKDGKLIGDIGINWILPQHRLAMLGAAISEEDYWGGGYGTDALLLVVDHAFDWLDMRKVWLTTMGLNARVIRQMEKVGFKLEARGREKFLADGQWTDELIYGMLREEWPGRAAMIERLGLKPR